MHVETKSFAVKDFDLKDTGEVAVAFAEIGVTDREKDYTFPGAIPTKSIPISQFSHSIWPERGGLPPAGRGEAKEDGNLAVFRGNFFLKTQAGRDTYETVVGMGDLQEWSYGYVVKESATPPSGQGAVRGLKSLDIFEISPVLVGAGGATRTLAVKSLDLKSFGSDVSEAQYAIGTIVRIIENESRRNASGDSTSEADLGALRAALNALRTYTVATFGQVGSDADLAELAAERENMLKTATLEAMIKDNPLAGLPVAEMTGRVLAGVEAWVQRLEQIKELRLKEGRAISTRRLEELAGSKTRLAEAIAAIDKIIAEATPKPAEADGEAEGKARLMRMRARLGAATVELASVRS